MDKQAKTELEDILSDSGIDPGMMEGAIEDIVHTFNNYRSRMRRSIEDRKEIEETLRNEEKNASEGRTVHFERFMWSECGKRIGHEQLSVHLIKIPGDDWRDLMDRAYTALFKLNPDWGRGLPLVDGRGWSTALPVHKPPY